MNIVTRETLSDAEREALIAPLKAHNAQFGFSFDLAPIAFALQNDSGETVGGVLGEHRWGWLYLKAVSVPKSLERQRYGTQLMDAAEAWARENGCRYVWLDTYSFQARPFYEKRGYKVFGEMPDYPPGERRYFLYKDLQAGA